MSHPHSSKCSVTFLAFATIATALPLASEAAVLLYEPFDYATGTDAIVGKTGGEGFGETAWGRTADTGHTGSLNQANVVASSNATFSANYTRNGNAMGVRNNHNRNGAPAPTPPQYLGVTAHRQLPASFDVPAGSSVWMSYLFRQEQSQGSSGYARSSLFRVGTAATGSTKGFVVAPMTQGGNNNPDNAAFGYDSSTVATAGGVYNNQSSVLMLAKYENVNGTGDQIGKFWMLSSANWDAIDDGTITEAELDANNLATLTETVSGVTLSGGDFIQFVSSTADGAQNNSIIDEFRVFTDLADIEPTLVPEPAALALVAAAPIALLRRRRRA